MRKIVEKLKIIFESKVVYQHLQVYPIILLIVYQNVMNSLVVLCIHQLNKLLSMKFHGVCLNTEAIKEPIFLSIDSKLPSKLPVPLTTYEADGSDPVLQSKHLTSLQDARTRQILEWDRVQLRNVNFYRKPLENVAPLPRAKHISGYSGSIGGYNIQDIDNPTVDFQPYTVVRTEQPKFGINPL